MKKKDVVFSLNPEVDKNSFRHQVIGSGATPTSKQITIKNHAKAQSRKG